MKHSIKNSFQSLIIPTPDINIFTYASETGCGIIDGHNPSRVQWAKHERMHINALDRKAAFTGICTYCHNRSYKHIWVMSHSSKAIACVNEKGGTKFKKCSEIAKEIWLSCFKNNYIISVAHIPGKKQTHFLENLTVMQNDNLLRRYLLKFLISLPTQKLIFLLPEQMYNFKIVSWSWEPEDETVDPFLTDWGRQFSYIFHPFSLLGELTPKIWQEKAHCIDIIRKWTTQYWYPVIMEMTTSKITIKPAPNNLLLPQDKKKLHPLHKNLTLPGVLIHWK